MKTSSTLIAALFTFTIIALASVNEGPQHKKATSAYHQLASLTVTNNDGDDVANARESSVTSNAVSLPVKEISLDYLRFDVAKYITESEPDLSELPDPDYNYLKFDVNTYMEENPADMDDMPASDFNYLKFNVNDYLDAQATSAENLGEMPVAE